MPKVPSTLPLSGLFGVIKPSGPTSMHIVNQLKTLVEKSRLFVEAEKLEKGAKKRKRRGGGNVKIGQGGTLDPLADGVLVVGVGKGTKRLNDFLDCSKEYRTTCLLGCETDTYDSEGARVRVAPWRHVTQEKVETALAKFRGEIQQAPPIFSALKMDGMPLYDYARKGIPLPRPIEKRPVTIHSLELVEWKGSAHAFRWPEKQFSQDQKAALEKSLSTVTDAHAVLEDAADPEEGAADAPTAFVLKMKVSGGTYVRSIVHDLAHELGSAGHVVTLTRSRQKDYVLEPEEEGDRRCVPWEVFEEALGEEGEKDDEGWLKWEREVLDKIVIVDGGKGNP
ncbi:pseudouridine synthase [Artomyces pyxidatus]|uniref:Pseudouridine synthase n=1 Tax=Artomyces pyxidatus TaxID=48021 RepID=A0ACB8T7P9_9AGAM|nr:pseudouridine synthase [Artomyces pyxidatus]